MKEILNKNAGFIAVVTTIAFAVLLWSYAMQGVTETTNFIAAGIALLLLDVLALWSMSINKTINKNKKGKR